jgi:nucleotide-binding universal stress UspA family protein
VRTSGVPITSVLRVGPAWEQILRTSQEQGAELIVIGSRGLHGLPRALMGSTAERVVRHSPVPVMTLHGPVPQITAQKLAAKEADALVDQWLI